MTRKLASIQEVRNVIKHPNADAIEIAQVEGWQCISKLGEFKPGDLGVYFEIDSFVPASDERFAFLEKNFVSFEDYRGARIKTIRLRGELSQGLILPLSAFPEVTDTEIGTDLTELLGVIKWEKSMPSFAEAKGNFPSFIEKTDQERVQNLRKMDRTGTWERTEKLDGTSMTTYLVDGEFGVCSRNYDLLETADSSTWVTVRRLDIENRLRTLGKNIALQGELMGPKIQENRYKLLEYTYFVYDVYDIDAKRKMLPHERKEVMDALNSMPGEKIKEVPFIGFVTLPEGEDWIDVLLKDAEGQSLLNNSTIREGDVFKHTEKNVSFKAISNKFLLKYDE
ncbi:RNA ligase [compost metagenome]